MATPAAPGRAAGESGRSSAREFRATEAADGVFRVRRRGRPPGAARGRVLMIAGLLTILLVTATAVTGALRSGSAPAPQAVAAVPAADAARAARYEAALALGRAGRYVEARRRMLALGGYRSAEAAARSYGTRAAQLLVARARALEGRRARVGRTLVANAAELAPGLPSLRRVRELVGLSP